MIDFATFSDRRVHAQTRLFQIVRYDRSGKWYAEPTDTHIPRHHISVAEAARRSVDASEVLDGTIYFGVPGGQVFERKVRKLVESRGRNPEDLESIRSAE